MKRYHAINDCSPVHVRVPFPISPGTFYVSAVKANSTFPEVLASTFKFHVKPKKHSPCIVLDNNHWKRGEVDQISADGKLVQVSLLDNNTTVSVTSEKVKTLELFEDQPGLLCQVGLYGIGSAENQWSVNECKIFQAVIECRRTECFLMIPKGLDNYGSLKVELKDKHGRDIKDMLIEGGGGIQLKENLNMVALLKKEKFPSIDLPRNVAVEASVIHFESPNKLFLRPTSFDFQYMDMVGFQNNNVLNGILNPFIGLLCLALIDNIDYGLQRVQIQDMSDDGYFAVVFLVDVGMIKKVAVSDLKELSEKMTKVPGLVTEASLVNITRPQNGWGYETLGKLMAAFDPNGNTSFLVKNIGKDDYGQIEVKMLDKNSRKCMSEVVNHISSLKSS